jgi:hypothetical protein
MMERRHAGRLLGGPHMHHNTSRGGYRRSGVLIGALALLLGASCVKSNGDDCGSLMRGCLDIVNSIDRSLSVSATPPGTVVNLPAAIYYSAIDEGLGSVAVDGTVDASTVFVVIEGGTAEATVTCTVSSSSWVGSNPWLVVGDFLDGGDGLTCLKW